jgi:hypothetical protein
MDPFWLEFRDLISKIAIFLVLSRSKNKFNIQQMYLIEGYSIKIIINHSVELYLVILAIKTALGVIALHIIKVIVNKLRFLLVSFTKVPLLIEKSKPLLAQFNIVKL